MDKVIARKLMETESIPTPVWRYPVTPELVLEMGLPAVIKPRSEGSSVGLTILREAGEIASAIEQAGGLSGALVERYIMGRELSVAVLGQGDDARCLGSVEIRPAVNFYDYDAKYNRNDTRYIVPAPVPETIQRRIAALALAVHRLLGCDGATRTDFLWDEQQEPVVLEINTIPGMTGHSLLPMIAAHAGLSYEDLVEAILEQASLKAASDCNPIR
jgi:D-alanine-D-alanine ligase